MFDKAEQLCKNRFNELIKQQNIGIQLVEYTKPQERWDAIAYSATSNTKKGILVELKYRNYPMSFFNTHKPYVKQPKLIGIINRRKELYPSHISKLAIIYVVFASDGTLIYDLSSNLEDYKWYECYLPINNFTDEYEYIQMTELNDNMLIHKITNN